MESQLPQIVRALREADEILVTCHRSPDGDAMGSLLAMGLILRELGKRPTLYSPNPVPQQFAFLPLPDEVVTRVQADIRFDVSVALDTGDEKLLGPEFPGADRRHAS